jgi:hypothetical protein
MVLVDVSMPLNHTFGVAYLQFQVVMVAFTVMMVAFSAKGGYPEFSLSASAIYRELRNQNTRWFG